MDRIDAMRLFLAVVEQQGFTAAARAERVSTAAASRAIARLEAELGTVLLVRTTRAVRLTTVGAHFAERCRALLDAHDTLIREISNEAQLPPRGHLALTAPVVFGRLHVLPIVEALMGAHSDLNVRLLLVDRPVNLVEEGFDAAVRIGTLADSTMLGQRLGQVRPVIVASPDYLARHGVPTAAAMLRQHRVIGFDGFGGTDSWHFGPDGRTVVQVTPALRVNLAQAALDAAVRGVGIARLLSYQVSEQVAAGQLVLLLADVSAPSVPVTLVYPAARRGSANLRAFARLALDRLAVLPELA